MNPEEKIVSSVQEEQIAWIKAEERDFLLRMKMSYTERFQVMTKLMKRGRMLKLAKISHTASR